MTRICGECLNYIAIRGDEAQKARARAPYGTYSSEVKKCKLGEEYELQVDINGTCEAFNKPVRIKSKDSKRVVQVDDVQQQMLDALNRIEYHLHKLVTMAERQQ